MIEIINRPEQANCSKGQFEGNQAQISFNSDGRLVVRILNSRFNQGGFASDFEDSLIVFDANVSSQIVYFIQNALRCRSHNCNRNIAKDDVPF